MKEFASKFSYLRFFKFFLSIFISLVILISVAQIASAQCAGGACRTACLPTEVPGPGTCSDPNTPICCVPLGGTGPGGSGINWGALIGIGTPAFPAGSSIGAIIYALLPYIFAIAGFLLLLYIIWAGFQILNSQGDPKALAAGREKITGAIIGLLIIFVAFWVVQILAQILNLQPIIDIFGTGAPPPCSNVGDLCTPNGCCNPLHCGAGGICQP